MFKDRVENNSLKNVFTYWEQKNWPILFQELLITFVKISTTFDICELLGKDLLCRSFLWVKIFHTKEWKGSIYRSRACFEPGLKFMKSTR